MSQTERTERGSGKGRRERAEVPPERQAAARRQIRTLGDPVLREEARPVDKFDDELAALSRRMIAVMRDAPGVGLAATQLGVVQRVLVYEVDDEPVTLVNPTIVAASRETEVAEEGCLSLPGMNLQVERAVVVHVHAVAHCRFSFRWVLAQSRKYRLIRFWYGMPVRFAMSLK